MKRKARQANVRFDDEVLRRLSRLALTVNLDVSDLVRAAVAAKLPEWEKDGVTFKSAKRQKASP